MKLAFFDEIELSGVGYMAYADWKRLESVLTVTSCLVLIDVAEVETKWEAIRHIRYLSNVPVNDAELERDYGPDRPMAEFMAGESE